MSDVIKWTIKQIEQSGADDFELDVVESGEDTLYEHSEPPAIELGSDTYEFQMEIYVEDINGNIEKRHTVYVSQTESGEVIA